MWDLWNDTHAAHPEEVRSMAGRDSHVTDNCSSDVIRGECEVCVRGHWPCHMGMAKSTWARQEGFWERLTSKWDTEEWAGVFQGLGWTVKSLPLFLSPTIPAWWAHAFLPEWQSRGKRRQRRSWGGKTALYIWKDPCLDWILVQRHWLPQTIPNTQKSVFPRVPQSTTSLGKNYMLSEKEDSKIIYFRNTE